MACRVRVCVLGAVLALALPADVIGQTVTDARGWFGVIAQHRPRARSAWETAFEGIAHSRDGLRARDVFGTRVTLLRRLSARTALGGGYLYDRAFAASGVVVEHRVFGQFTTAVPAAGGTWAFRTRVEARFIDGNGGEVTRLRQQVGFTRPWRTSSRLAVTASDELLVHANGSVRGPRGVDQNRVFAGVSVAVSGGRLQVGYLNDLVPGHGRPRRVSHILSTTLTILF